MSLMQLIPSLMAIILLSVAAFYLFPGTPALTEEGARTAMAEYAPDAVISTLLFSNDRRTALITFKQPEKMIGFVSKLGDKLVCRTLLSCHQVSYSLKDDCLIIHSRDFTSPRIAFQTTEQTMQQARNLLEYMGIQHAA